MNEERKPFDEFTAEAISSLNSLMTCNEVCKIDKAVIKINRFKKWLIDLQKETAPVTNNEVTNI